MGGYDDCKVATLTASQGAATNGLNFPLRIHKVSIENADGAAQARADLFDAATVAGTSVVSIEAPLADGTTFKTYEATDFNPPIGCENGVSSTIAANTVCKVYYTRR
jgi:hypothetical protein